MTEEERREAIYVALSTAITELMDYMQLRTIVNWGRWYKASDALRMAVNEDAEALFLPSGPTRGANR